MARWQRGWYRSTHYRSIYNLEEVSFSDGCTLVVHTADSIMWESGWNYRGELRENRMVHREDREREGEVAMSRGSGEERV